MEKSISYFQTLSHEQLTTEIPVLFQLLNEEKVAKSQELAEFLLKYPNEITPYIFELFESDTPNMKLIEWTLETIIPQLPFFVKIALEDSLQRIAQSPTDEEKSLGLDEKALNVLNDFI